MTMKEFSCQLNGREYDVWMLTKREVQAAKDNGWVVVTGCSDWLVEFDGALCDEWVCFDGGEVHFSKNGVYNGKDDKAAFPNCIEAIWCGTDALDEDGKVIPWTYRTDIQHETFMIYKNDEPYCRGIVFSVDDLK